MTGKTIRLGRTGLGIFGETIGDDLPGNADRWSAAACEAHDASPLAGKTLYWLGSSVTYGYGSKGEAVPDYLAKRCGCISMKSAIGGTSLADLAYGEEPDNPWQVRVQAGMLPEEAREMAKLSYVARLGDFPRDGKPDLFILQSSTNDSQFPAAYLGNEKGGCDPHTTFGAMRHILACVRETWGCPVLVYTSPLLDTENYRAMVRGTRALCAQEGAALLDLNGDEAFNALGRAHMDDWMVDPVHPTRQGYLEWLTPAFEACIASLIG